MKIIYIEKIYANKQFAIYEIDEDCDYSHCHDMIAVASNTSTQIRMTITENPKQWVRDNLGMSETPIATYTKIGFERCGFFGRDSIFVWR